MVLAAMLENDDDLVDLIREIQEAKGRGDRFNPKRLHKKIEVLGPVITLSDLRRSIDVEVVDRLGTSWDFWYGLLQKYRKDKGHCRVKKDCKVDGLRLGSWAHNQRTLKGRLSLDRLERLNLLGFVWDPVAEQWEQNFAALQRFREREGHLRVAEEQKVDGLNLGHWIKAQRHIKDSLTPDRVKRLNSLGFSWDPYAEQWEKRFAALKKFCRREGHCRVKEGDTVDGLRLASWVSNQRSTKDSLTPDRLKRLKSLGFIWDVHSEQWEKNFAALQKFHKRKGHCRVNKGHIVDGLNLGSWCSIQRQRKKRLTSDQIKCLNSLGFSWDPHAEQWEENFAALQKFRKREGHCRFKKNYKVDGLKLGQWAQVQRATKEMLTPDRAKRLNSLGFIWDLRTEQWERNFAALQKFRKREGHCRFKNNYKMDGLKLGQWAQVQRVRKELLTPDRIKRLNSLGFSWDPIAEFWDRNFAALQKFSKREGHCRPKMGCIVDGLNIGRWVNNQQWTKGRLSTKKIALLNSLGFVWKK
jgi:DNA-binding TFAR19-related protein (PDSD5 family)